MMLFMAPACEGRTLENSPLSSQEEDEEVTDDCKHTRSFSSSKITKVPGRASPKWIIYRIEFSPCSTVKPVCKMSEILAYFLVASGYCIVQDFRSIPVQADLTVFIFSASRHGLI